MNELMAAMGDRLMIIPIPPGSTKAPSQHFLNAVTKDETAKANLINQFRYPIVGAEVYKRCFHKLLGAAKDNTKLDKANRGRFILESLTLAPATLSGFNTCPFSTPECRESCLKYAGRMAFESVTRAQVIKTLGFFKFRKHFMVQLRKDLTNLEKRAKKQGKKAAVRLNVLSDINWCHLIEEFPSILFYDYTKNLHTFQDMVNGLTPKNYHITASWSEEMTINQVKDIVGGGFNVAVPFLVKKGDCLPGSWHGITVIDGERSDLRFLDPAGVIIGLKAKGKAKKVEKDGFVIVNHEGRKS